MTRRPGTRAFLAVGMLVTLLLAGVASYYASSHPDGLEYVAERAGFLHTSDDSATADGPLADYRTRGVEGDRASGALAGVVGVGAVGLLCGGLFWVVRRRGDRRPVDEES